MAIASPLEDERIEMLESPSRPTAITVRSTISDKEITKANPRSWELVRHLRLVVPVMVFFRALERSPQTEVGQIPGCDNADLWGIRIHEVFRIRQLKFRLFCDFARKLVGFWWKCVGKRWFSGKTVT